MKLGFDCKLYRSEPGVITGEPATIEVTTVKDTSLVHLSDAVEILNRSSRYKKYLQGMIDSGIEVNFDFDSEDAHCMMFLEAAVEGTLLPLYVELDDGIGLDADFEVFMQELSQPLSELESLAFNCKPSAKAGREPNFIMPEE